MQESKGLRAARAATIEKMKEALATAEKCEAPRWLITLMVIPIYLWEVLKAGLSMLLIIVTSVSALLISAVITPFVCLYVFADIVLIMRWFFSRIIDKMCGEIK